MLIAVHGAGGRWEDDTALTELAQLVRTAGAVPVDSMVQRLHAPHPHSYFGRGKVDELKALCAARQAGLVVADDELSAGQQRTLEGALGRRVIDRTAVILDIFAQHAQSRDGRLQVELAQLRYALPRLVSTEKALSRLGAGIGTRGPGEARLETDRRRVKARITRLLAETEALRAHRAVHRRWRGRQGVETVALVGYTNAGKSSLFNALTGAETPTEDQLFATLDPATRQLALPGSGRILLSDTVGFIQKLPIDLVVAFRATLEEVVEADVLVHVVDASHPRWLEQAMVVYQELEALGALDRPMVTALNKADLCADPISSADLEAFPHAVAVSGVSGFGLDALRGAVGAALAGAYCSLTVHVPYTRGDLVHLFRERGRIEHEDFDAAGTLLVGRIPTTLAGLYHRFEVARSAS